MSFFNHSEGFLPLIHSEKSKLSQPHYSSQVCDIFKSVSEERTFLKMKGNGWLEQPLGPYQSYFPNVKFFCGEIFS